MTSEKPLDISTSPPSGSSAELVLMLDENLSSEDIAVFLRRIHGVWTIQVQTDHLARGTSDVEVIKHCGDRNWMLVSCDDRIRYVPENKKAWRENGGRVYAFPRGNYQGAEYAAALIVARTQIANIARKTAAPFYARIFIRGEAQLLEPQITEGSSSQQKTAAKYGNNAIGRKRGK